MVQSINIEHSGIICIIGLLPARLSAAQPDVKSPVCMCKRTETLAS